MGAGATDGVTIDLKNLNHYTVVPPETADSSLKRKEVLSGKHNFEQQLKTGASMVDKKLEIFNSTSLLKKVPKVVLKMDASLTGWGAVLQGKSTGGT